MIIRSRWRRGLVRLQQWSYYLQGPGFESHLRPVEFFSCIRFLHSPNQTLTPTSVLWYNMKTCFLSWYQITTINKVKKRKKSDHKVIAVGHVSIYSILCQTNLQLYYRVYEDAVPLTANSRSSCYLIRSRFYPSTSRVLFHVTSQHESIMPTIIFNFTSYKEPHSGPGMWV